MPARKGARVGFNILAGGRWAPAGFTIASLLDVFVAAPEAAEVTAELVRI